MARRDRVVPKEELIEVVWPGLVVEDNNLQVQISALRKVLGRRRSPPCRDAATSSPSRAAAAPASRRAPPRGRRRRRRDPRRAEQRRRRARSRLLVADDNKVNRLLLCRSLELMGHTVASADNGRAALEKLRGERFDLLLLDLEMPEMDGFACSSSAPAIRPCARCR